MKNNNEKIKELEHIRKIAVLRLLLLIIFAIAIIVILCISIKSFELFIECLTVAIVAIPILNHINKDKFTNKYKELVIRENIESLYESTVYIPDSGINPAYIYSTGTILTGNHSECNDYIKGKYKDVSFETSNILLELHRESSNGAEHTIRKYFEGQWYIFEFNKDFKERVNIIDKKILSKNTFASNKSKEAKEYYEGIEVEDKEFNSLFNIYSENKEEAFYVLSPQTIEAIKEIKKATKSKLVFSFINSKLHIGIYNNKKLYAHSIFKKVDLEKEYNKTIKEMKLIQDLIEKLRLDNKLFK